LKAKKSTAKTVAVRLLSRREHSAHEISQKLMQRDFDADDIAQAVDDLQCSGYLSDSRFADVYIRMRRLKGYGPVRIRQELQQRGVNEATIDTGFGADSSDWQHVLTQQYEKKYHDRPVLDYTDKSRRIRFLQYRGFTLEAIQQLFDQK